MITKICILINIILMNMKLFIKFYKDLSKEIKQKIKEKKMNKKDEKIAIKTLKKRIIEEIIYMIKEIYKRQIARHLEIVEMTNKMLVADKTIKTTYVEEDKRDEYPKKIKERIRKQWAKLGISRAI